MFYNRTNNTDKGFFQCVTIDRLDEIDQYGNILQKFDASDFISIDTFNVARDILKDFVSGNLSCDLDNMIHEIQKSGKFRDQIEDLLNPDNIVDSAGIWDDQGFVSWFSEKYEISGVALYDGGIKFNMEV